MPQRGPKPDDHSTGTDQIMAIYQAEIHGLYAMVARRCGSDRALAEDITQETWLRAIRDWAKNGLPRSAGGWLRTVALNLIRDHARRRRPELIPAESLQAWLAQSSEAPDASIVDTVIWGLSKLSTTHARILGAFHIDGRSTKQIAEELNLSQKAVERRLSRARQKLRSILEPSLTNESLSTTHTHEDGAECELHSTTV